MGNRTLLVQREFTDIRDGQRVFVHVTHPILVDSLNEIDTWVCYVHISGIDDGEEIIPITDVSEFGSIIGAADIIHHRLAVIEEHLVWEDKQGFCGFSRVMSGVESKKTLEKIDQILLNAKPKIVKRINPDNLKRKPY